MAHLEITQHVALDKFFFSRIVSFYQVRVNNSRFQKANFRCSFENYECSTFTMKKENLLVGPGPTGGPGPPRTSKKKKKNRFEGKILSEMK